MILPRIRFYLKQKQQQLVEDARKTGSHKAAVLEGRDIGTVVFPDADLKFFVDAPLEVRAQRRVEQLIEKGEKADFELVYLGLKERDTKDRSRVVAPLKPAKDAMMIDTGGMVMQEVLESLYRHIESIN